MTVLFTFQGFFQTSVIIRMICLFCGLIALSSCTVNPPKFLENSRNLSALTSSPSPEKLGQKVSPIWSSSFNNSDWQQDWAIQPDGDWGWENLTVIPDPSGRFAQVLRVQYPAHSANYQLAKTKGNPVGGGQFYAKLGISPQDSLRLGYFIRFSENFDFVKGGKLPGLFGGRGNSGGNIPDGGDGFSTRYMWRRQGAGEVYAYLPGSREHGTSLGRGNWQFQPERWYYLEQEVKLNQPGAADGSIRVWVDGQLVLEALGLVFRSTETLQIEGVFFSTFFGGNDQSWATPQDVSIDFAEFRVSLVGEGE